MEITRRNSPRFVTGSDPSGQLPASNDADRVAIERNAVDRIYLRKGLSMTDTTMSRRTIIGGTAALAIPTAGNAALAEGSDKAVLGRRDGRWLSEPKRWNVDATGDLSVVTDKGTDFWREPTTASPATAVISLALRHRTPLPPSCAFAEHIASSTIRPVSWCASMSAAG